MPKLVWSMQLLCNTETLYTILCNGEETDGIIILGMTETFIATSACIFNM